MFPAVMTFGDLYHVTLTSEQLTIIIFLLGTPECHNLGTKTTKLTRIQLYLFYMWPFWIYAKLEGVNPPQKVRPISGFDKYLSKVICANFGAFLQK